MAYFVGLDLNDQTRDHLSELQKTCGDQFPEVTWLGRDQLFAVLKFLGELDENSLKPIRKAATTLASEIAPFEISLAKSDCFPATDPPRTVWVGIQEQNDMLWRLMRGCESKLLPSVAGEQNRSTIPHIVIGRIPAKTVQGNLRKRVQGFAVEPLSARVEDLLLIESRSGKKGTEYHVSARFPFTANVWK